jgi:PRTRC genetic system ThiF family protein
MGYMRVSNMSTPVELNLDFVNAARLLLPAYDSVTLALVGCGGTGSWLAPSLARIARLLAEKFHKEVALYFIDPDRVEAKNVYRQNFCEAEVGRFKADALAFRYGLAWGVEISAPIQPFERTIFNGSVRDDALKVVVGCVDNAAARRNIEAAVTGAGQKQARYWWLDCGNHQSAGQIVLGCGVKRPQKPFELAGYCSWLPLPTIHHPELLRVDQGEKSIDQELSCADLALQDSQGLAINQRIAAEASDYLVRLLITKDLQKYATYIDLASGSARSKYITPAIMENRNE